MSRSSRDLKSHQHCMPTMTILFQGVQQTQPTCNKFQTSLVIPEGEILMLGLKFVNVVWLYEHNFEVMRKLFDLEFCYKYNMI